jgi:glycosyl transferase family 25
MEIEKVIYINLDHRTDRKEQIQKELLKVFELEKVERFNAIKDSNGAIGCSKSHIAVLELAIKNNWKNVLIVEDDMIFNNENFSENINLLNELSSKSYDVIVLGGTYVDYDNKTNKLFECQTTTAYLVSNQYYQKLISEFKFGLENLIKSNNQSKYAIDQVWKPLQKNDNWYIIQPALCIQSIGYSDIEGKKINYNHLFNLKKDIREHRVGLRINMRTTFNPT